MSLTMTEDEKYKMWQTIQVEYLNNLLFDTDPLFETNMAGFLSYVSKKVSNEGQKVDVVPLIVTEFIDVPITNGMVAETLLYSLIGIMKQAQPVAVSANDYTVVDYGAVETNDNATSMAKSILIGTADSMRNIYQWHLTNNTHHQFEQLFIPLQVYPELLQEDEFLVLKQFPTGENLRLFAVDINDEQIRIAVSPHIKARLRRVRKSIIAQPIDHLHIDNRYSGEAK